MGVFDEFTHVVNDGRGLVLDEYFVRRQASGQQREYDGQGRRIDGFGKDGGRQFVDPFQELINDGKYGGSMPMHTLLIVSSSACFTS